MSNALHTKWGTAKIQPNGYYRITSAREGNNNKDLHRLIFEDFYGFKIPKGYVIHHKNGIKTDNCILNLQLLSKKQHQMHHNSGEKHWTYNNPMPAETRRKIGEASKGRIVSKETREKLSKIRKGRIISKDTREKISKKLKGRKLSEEHKLKLSESHKGQVISEDQKILMSKSISKSTTSTGIYRVSKHKNKGTQQGFVWRYMYKVNGKKKEIVSVDIKRLKKKVLVKGLEWIILDEDKVKKLFGECP